MSRAKAFLAGIGLAFFLDPAQGKRRRHVVRDRTTRLARRTKRISVGKTRFTVGHVRGQAARLRRVLVPREVALDDRTVEQRIRSDTFREVGVSPKDVELGVEDGIVTLRGSVDEPALAEDLISRVRKVPGVVDVAAMLRVTSSQADRHAA